jgi:hypothetical protein
MGTNAQEPNEPGLEILTYSGCISECVHRETIVYYIFAEPIGTDLVESLAKVGALYLDPVTGIFKIAKVDHFYIFGVLGETELRICMYYQNKISDRLAIDRQLIEYFRGLSAGEDPESLQLKFNKSGSLARVARRVADAQAAVA